MDETAGTLAAIDYRRVFPWVHLFRAFRIALSLRKMILASVGLLALSAGDLAFSYLPFAPKPPTVHHWPWDASYGDQVAITSSFHPIVSPEGNEPASAIGEFLENPAELLLQAFANWELVLRPLRTLIEPAEVLFRSGTSWPEVAYAWTRLLWALIVWAIFGGAITRIAAVQFARDEIVNLRSALRFSSEKFLSYLTAPLLPIIFFGFFWVLSLSVGLIGRIPSVGEILVGLGWFLPLLFGLVMALILLFIAVGWPLMLATISAEGSDGFDGFSRSCSYVYSRPWHYLWFAVVAMTYGSAVIFVVWLFAELMVYLAGWSVAAGMGVKQIAELTNNSPFILVWHNLVDLLLAGFVYSYFWTASTIIYFLLRQSDDATELDEVYLAGEDEPDELLSLVGVAASDQPVVERPPVASPEDAGRRQNADSNRTGEAKPVDNEPSGDSDA